MRSDNGALSAVDDALGLGAATVDTAYAGLEAVVDVLSEFKAKLVASKEEGVDKGKIQDELEQLKQQVQSIAASSSFSGQNWLSTEIEDIYDNDLNAVSLTSGFSRSSAGHVAVNRIDVNLEGISLFNRTGGGLLQADARDSLTLGGMRYFSETDEYYRGGTPTVYYGEEGSGFMYPRWGSGSGALFDMSFPAGTSLDFNIPGAQISFQLTIDKEASNPDGAAGANGDLQELPGPYFDGRIETITITKAEVDAYPALGGIISTNTDFANVVNRIIQPMGASMNANFSTEFPPGSGTYIHDDATMRLSTRQLPANGFGSYVGVSNLSSVGVSTGGLVEQEEYGTRGSGMLLNFDQFVVHKDGENEDGVEISFSFAVNNAPAKTYSFNRTYVNDLLGKDSGKVETSEEMATLLHSLLDEDWPGLVIEGNSESTVMIKSDPAVDRQWGFGTRIAFDNVTVNIEPLPIMNFIDIDIEKNPEMFQDYLDYLEVTSARVIDATALVGSLSARLSMQADFTGKLMANIERGIGRLVDADMNEMSTRLRALETQEQLSIQTLSIANSNSENILLLFR
jgi:flagellin